MLKAPCNAIPLARPAPSPAASHVDEATSGAPQWGLRRVIHNTG